MRSFFRLVSAAPAPRIVAMGSGRAVAIEVEEEAEEAPAAVDQLATAKEHLAALQPPEPPASAEDEQRALEQAWLLGQALAALKRQAGHGRWLALLAAEFPQGLSHQNAGRYLRFFRANPPPSEGKDNVPTNFSAESIQRLRWNYVPAKEQPSTGAAKAAATRQRLTERRVVSALQRWEALLSSGETGEDAVATEAVRQASKPILQRLTKLLGREFVLELLAQPTDQDPAGR